jgi:FMN-dependent NADH-azoreductase
MPTLFHLDSSPMPSSVSRELGREFVSTWKAAHADGTVIYRDVATNVPSHVDAVWVGAAYTLGEARSSEQNAALALSDVLIGELEQADEYVIDVAMHNFSIPSTLKLWIDQIVRVGRTFAYSANGPEGLLKGKKLTILLATGGVYDAGSPYAPYNFADPYLKVVFGFLGVTDVTIVTAGGAAQLNQPNADREAFLKPILERVHSIAA